MSNEKMKSALKSKTIAIVGLFRDANKYSHRMGVPEGEWMPYYSCKSFCRRDLVEKCYKTCLRFLRESKKQSKSLILQILPRNPPILEQAIQLKQKYSNPIFIWMQLGMINNQAAELAEKTVLEVIMDGA